VSERDQGAPGRGARARILTAARVLFTERGINVTGVAELCAAAHVSKRTLYHHFSGKDDVVRAYLSAVAADASTGPEAVLSRSDLAPRARLLELFATLAAERRPLRGSPFVNAAVEVPDPDDPVHRLAAEHAGRFAERLADLARAAGARNAEQVGRRLALLYHGAAAHAIVFDSPEAVIDATAIATVILRDAIDTDRSA
jgi:AcrR family transcriptional regulator